MCFVLCLKLLSWGRPEDITMQPSLQDVIRTTLDVSSKFITHWINTIAFFLVVRLKLYSKNVIVINFIECIKLTFSGRPQNITMWTSPRDIFHTSFGRLSKILSRYKSCFFMFPSTCLPTYLYVYLQSILKNQRYRNEFLKKYAQK